MTFHEHSKQIVEDYLGTVAYVDDLIFSSKKEVQPEVVISATTLREAVATKELSQRVEKDIPQQLAPNIDPLTFTNAFLEKGIHCALLEVTNEDDSLEPIKKTLKKSDVIILDWQMHGDLGEKATELLLSVIESDRPELRLIIIFTDEPNYSAIIPDTIVPRLNKIGINDIEIDETTCYASFGHTRIIVLEKDVAGDNVNAVSVGELPSRVIEELTKLTKGLVSNAALNSISILRHNTHYLLNTLNKDLDPAILSHRALLSDPTECEEHLVSIISSEIVGLLHYSDIGKTVSMEQIKLWIHDQAKNGIDFFRKMKVKKKDEAILEIFKILEKGIPNISPSKSKNKTWNNFLSILKHEKDKSKISNLTSIFTKNTVNLTNIDEEFAHLMTFQSNYQFPKPRLDQGTILMTNTDDVYKYFVCIQPKCDCVRIKKTGAFFMFLPLSIVNGNSRFDFLIKEGNEVKRLAILQNSNVVEKFKFYSDKTGLPVFALKNQSNWYFKGDQIESTNKIEINFRFLGYLKQEFIQRTVNNYASNITRVGFSESEWLRRWAKN